MDTRHHALMILNLLHEQSHPIPSISFSLQQGFTHTWMVDGEALVMMIAMISSNSPSRQGASTEFLTPEEGSRWRRCFVRYHGEVIIPPDVFRSRRLSSREGTRGGDRVDHTMWWCGHGPTMPSHAVGGSLPPLRLIF